MPHSKCFRSVLVLTAIAVPHVIPLIERDLCRRRRRPPPPRRPRLRHRHLLVVFVVVVNAVAVDSGSRRLRRRCWSPAL